MRRIVSILVLLTLSVHLVGCAEQPEPPSTTNILQDTPDFLYLTEVSEENLICVQIPVVTSLRKQVVNACIKEQVYLELQRYLADECHLKESATAIANIEEKIDTSAYSKQYLHISSQISFQSGLISLIFTGTHNVKSAAHPNDVFFTINISLPDAKRMGITDITPVDDGLYSAFLQYVSSDRISQEELKSSNVFEKEAFLEGLTQEPEKGFYSYVTPTHIGISYPVPHALGDHIEAEIPYEAIGIYDLQKTEIIDSGTYYRIYKGNITQVCYDIYNLAGEIVLSEKTDRPLEINMINDDIMDIEIGMGTGITIHKYYSVGENNFSQEFTYVLSHLDKLIAYIDVPKEKPMENRKVIVQNIFERSLFYKEFQLDFSNVDTPVVEAKFSEDGTSLQLTYLSGEEQTQISTVLDLMQ